MSATERAGLARAARAVLGAEAATGAGRVASLRRRHTGPALAPADFSELVAVPDWLPAQPASRRSLAIRAGLAALSPALSRTLDGATLRGFAAQTGDDLVDWSLKLGERDDAPIDQPPLHPEALETLGNAILGTAMPAPLRGRFPEAPPLPAAHAAWALDRAREIDA